MNKTHESRIDQAVKMMRIELLRSGVITFDDAGVFKIIARPILREVWREATAAEKTPVEFEAASDTLNTFLIEDA